MCERGGEGGGGRRREGEEGGREREGEGEREGGDAERKRKRREGERERERCQGHCTGTVKYPTDRCWLNPSTVRVDAIELYLHVNLCAFLLPGTQPLARQ